MRGASGKHRLRLAGAALGGWLRLGLSVGLGLSLGLPGLALSQPVPSSAPLMVAAFPDIDKIVLEALPAWKQRHPDVEVKVVSRQYGDHNTAMTTALSTGTYLPDVMALDVPYLGRFSQGSGLQDLNQPPFSIGRFADRFVPFALSQATTRRGAVIAAPADIGPGTLLYRRDVLVKAGLAEAELTRSWSSYVAAGVQIKARTGAYLMAHARDLKDVLIRTGLQPGQGLYFDKESRVLVNSPRFVRAFELAREVRRNRLDARVTTWSNDWSEGFRRGTLATQISGAWLAAQLANWMAPETRGKWAAAPLPDGTWAAYGGTFLAIPRGLAPERKALAWELIQLLTLDRERQLSAFKAHDAFPALLSAHEDPFFEQPLPFLGGQPARLMWRDAARHIQPVEVHKQDAFAEEVINTELDKVLDQGKDIGLALADAERLLQHRARR